LRLSKYAIDRKNDGDNMDDSSMNSDRIEEKETTDIKKNGVTLSINFYLKG